MPVSRGALEELLLEQAVPWAEARDLGIGGGFRAASPETREGARCWPLGFGLCATREGQSIPKEEAEHLLNHLTDSCRDRRLGCFGQVEEFPPADLDPDAPLSPECGRRA